MLIRIPIQQPVFHGKETFFFSVAQFFTSEFLSSGWGDGNQVEGDRKPVPWKHQVRKWKHPWKSDGFLGDGVSHIFSYVFLVEISFWEGHKKDSVWLHFFHEHFVKFNVCGVATETRNT